MNSSSSHSNVEMDHAECTWTIENFSHQGQNVGDLVKSPPFTLFCKSRHLWTLRIYPFGITEHSDKVLLYLDLVNSPRETTFAKINISYFDSSLKLISSEIGEQTFTKPLSCWYLAKVQKRSTLVAQLEDDVLQIAVEIDYASGSEVNRSSYSFPKELHSKAEEKLVEDFSRMFDDKRFCDVSINVEGKNILVHLFVLASRSPVFASMFEHDMQEKQSHHVDIVDFDCDTVDKFLRYLYSGKLPTFKYELAGSLLEIADKYQVDDLKIRCGHYLAWTLNCSNVLQVLLLADAHKCDKLKDSALSFICTNKSEFGSPETFLPVRESPKLLMDIVTRMAVYEEEKIN